VPDDCLKHETNGRTIKLVLLLNSFRLTLLVLYISMRSFCISIPVNFGLRLVVYNFFGFSTSVVIIVGF